MSARVNAWDNGKWVRDAAMAYAEKKELNKLKKVV
jgi:ring-1,2-phenylacetyl-CoA epoxidase subunit PaaA